MAKPKVMSLNPEVVIRQAEEVGIAELLELRRKAIKQGRGVFRKLQYLAAAECCVIAGWLQNDDEGWHRYREAHDLSPGKRKKVLLHLLQVLTGNDKKGSLQFRAVQQLLRDGVKPAAVAQELHARGGFSRVAANGARSRKPPIRSEKLRPALDVEAPTELSRPLRLDECWVLIAIPDGRTRKAVLEGSMVGPIDARLSFHKKKRYVAATLAYVRPAEPT